MAILCHAQESNKYTYVDISHMKHQTFKTPWLLILIILSSTIILYVYYNLLVSIPTQLGIFAVNPTSLTYGETTLSGTLRKDVPSGQPGTFILVLSDGRPVILNVSNLDSLLGRSVTISGRLSPSKNADPATMIVSTIQVTSP